MKTPQFNFKKHQNNRINWRRLVRLAIYIVVVFFLILFIINQQNPTDKKLENNTIEHFDVVIDTLGDFK